MHAKTTFAALAAIAALGLAGAVQAGTPSNEAAVTVSFKGVDLNSATGLEIAQSRILKAARAICGIQPDQRSLGDSRVYQACVTSVTDHAVGQLQTLRVASGQGAMRMALASGR